MKIVSGTRDLISDLHRQQRRRVLRRAAQLVGLAVTLLLVGLAFKFAADSRSRSRTLEAAREHFARGTAAELGKAGEALEESLEQTPAHGPTLAALALVQTQLHVEFGGPREVADAALAEAGETSTVQEAQVARGLLALADGEVDQAAEILAAARAAPPGQFAPEHPAWLAGALALAGPRSEDGIDPIAELDSSLARQPELVAHRRLRIGILMATGKHIEALDALERAREQSRTHMGLAADEALFHAYLRQELGGVADVADQLLASGDVVSPRDRAHALLARGVAHVHAGESEQGLKLIAESWPGVPLWDPVSRDLALQAVLEGGDGERALAWVEAAGLPKTEADIYAAWARFATGDVMKSLEMLATLPQEHPRVGYLQALALVEQLRFAEAGPWLDRAERLIPGRVELEVARARTELRMGDKAAALRKLQGLAEDEPHAPRAWTGLGEAYLAQKGDVDLHKAGKALERAIEREAVPAEAMLRAAEVWTRKRKSDADADRKALELLRRAAQTNRYLPRYQQAYALYLIDTGNPQESKDILRELIDEEGVSPDAVLALVRLETESGWKGSSPPEELETWLGRAEELAANPAAVERERARILVQRGDKESVAKARNRLRALLEKNPADVDSRILYSQASLRARERIEAEQAIRRGLQVTPDAEHARLYLAWAEVESRIGKRRKAAAHARVAWMRMLSEDRPPVELMRTAELATGLWLRERRETTALAIARELTDRLPYHGRAWTIRAATELTANRSDAARASAERALDLDDKDARAHELHGHALLRFGYKDRAREAYEKAVELAQGTPEEKEYRASLARL